MCGCGYQPRRLKEAFISESKPKCYQIGVDRTKLLSLYIFNITSANIMTLIGHVTGDFTLHQ